jgi:hypothetical protein
MAWLFSDDFESGTYNAWSSYNDVISTGFDGTYGARLGFGSYAIKSHAAVSEIYFFAFVRPAITGTAKYIFVWRKSGTELGSIRWNGTNILAYTGTSTLLATGTAVVTAVEVGGSWVGIECRVKIDASSGAIQVKVNNVTDISQTSINTVVSANTDLNESMIGHPSNGSGNMNFDNLWLNDTSGSHNTSWPGIKRCLTQFPTGKSATNDSWSASSGSNKYDLVDEQPASGSDYIYSETVGQKQGLTFPASSVPSNATIDALIINDMAIKISTGSFKQGVRLGGTDYPASVSFDPPVSYGVGSIGQHVLEVRPSDSAAWTNSDNPESYLERT